MCLCRTGEYRRVNQVKVTEGQHHPLISLPTTTMNPRRANHPRQLPDALTKGPGRRWVTLVPEKTETICGEVRCRPRSTRVRSRLTEAYCQHEHAYWASAEIHWICPCSMLAATGKTWRGQAALWLVFKCPIGYCQPPRARVIAQVRISLPFKGMIPDEGSLSHPGIFT